MLPSPKTCKSDNDNAPFPQKFYKNSFYKFHVTVNLKNSTQYRENVKKSTYQKWFSDH